MQRPRALKTTLNTNVLAGKNVIQLNTISETDQQPAEWLQQRTLQHGALQHRSLVAASRAMRHVDQTQVTRAGRAERAESGAHRDDVKGHGVPHNRLNGYSIALQVCAYRSH